MSWVRNLLALALLLFAVPAWAQTGCVPNPNNNGPPYIDGCPLTAAGLNAGFNSPVSQYQGIKCNNNSGDSALIQAAITTAAANGGGSIVINPKTICSISTTLAITTSQISVSCLGGKGQGIEALNGVGTACLFRWSGTSGGTIMSMIAPFGNTNSQVLWGNSVEGINFDGNGGLAANGLVLQSISHSMFKGLRFTGFNGGWALDLNIVHATTSNFSLHPDSQFNLFENISINQFVNGTVNGGASYTSGALRLGDWLTQASPLLGGNASFNTFINTDIWDTGGPGILLDGTDNNTFIETRVETGTAGYGVDFSIHCNSGACFESNSNYFYGLTTAPLPNQSIIARGQTTFPSCVVYTDRGFGNTNCTGGNMIMNLDFSNGSGYPVQEPGAQLWIQYSGHGKMQTAGVPVINSSSPCTGLGSTGTCVLNNSSTDEIGIINLTPSGTGIAASGTAAINLGTFIGSSFGASTPDGDPSTISCTAALRGAWANMATVSIGQVGPLTPLQGFVASWTNVASNGTAIAATNLTSGTTYQITYNCQGF